ncbi:hypothetical protein [Burkholderia latens]|uniref:hypothetical protein n=1 Tax=Burkholderia latens TaxID=488446 RepID=UPI001C940BF6|nr:hypothetical protein [Burkholderia latens]MBY4694826.1 hypothetical protein [Burkholderia latens]
MTTVTIFMLLTQPGWEEQEPAWRQLTKPYIPLRCVAVPDYSPCFFIHQDHPDGEDDELRIGGYLVTSPEDLLAVAVRLDVERCRIYRIRTDLNADKDCRLELIAALKSYEAAGGTWFAFESADGTVSPCFPWQPRQMPHCAPKTEWSAMR